MREQIFRQFQAQKSTFTGGKLRFQRAENGGKDAAQRAAELCGVALIRNSFRSESTHKTNALARFRERADELIMLLCRRSAVLLPLQKPNSYGPSS